MDAVARPRPALHTNWRSIHVIGWCRCSSDHELVAIQEDDLTAPQVWTAHFSSGAARDGAAAAIRRDVESTRMSKSSQSRSKTTTGRAHAGGPPRHPDRPGHGRTPVGPAREPHPREVLVIIEPSRGFGTGHHQSTRLCIALLQNRNLAGQTMIDVGTGSGVLAITAAKLGAAYVAAIDVILTPSRTHARTSPQTASETSSRRMSKTSPRPSAHPRTWSPRTSPAPCSTATPAISRG